MKTSEIASVVEEEFVLHYRHFRELKENPAYRPYWELCMAAVRDRELLGHIIFCNDVYRIPPVRTFLVVHTREIGEIGGDGDTKLAPFTKKAVGAFWGMVFKFALGYTDQETTTVPLGPTFDVRTATYFMAPKEEVRLEG